MRKFQRAPEPAFLAEHWERWGLEWEAGRSKTPKPAWSWREYEKTPVNQLLLKYLKPQTQAHCSFCDAFPVSPPSDDTIEHFRPKADYRTEAYRWSNLYFCCRFCQRKEGQFDEAVLRPDAEDYQFDRYFLWDYTLGEIKVNPAATPAEQRRAEITIRYFRLNVEHPSLRKRELRRRMKDATELLEDCPYRDFIDP